MATTQSEDPNERVCHPRHYNQSPSGIECIELIRHLPANFANAVKYVWRCGLKATETPLRDLKSAKWYTEDEEKRRDLFELWNEPGLKTDVVWRALAHQVIISDPGSTLADYLDALLRDSFDGMYMALDHAIEELTQAAVPSEVLRGEDFGVELKPGQYFVELAGAAFCSLCSGKQVTRFKLGKNGATYDSRLAFNHSGNCPKVREGL
jgi:hypothetical protein